MHLPCRNILKHLSNGISVSKNIAGEELSLWKDYPLSGFYRKNEIETASILLNKRKIVMKDINI